MHTNTCTQFFHLYYPRTEGDILLSTAVLARSVQFITDESLLSGNDVQCLFYAYDVHMLVHCCVLVPPVAEFVLCVLGRGGDESGEGEGSGRKEKGEGRSRLRALIIQRIDHPSDDVSCVTVVQIFLHHKRNISFLLNPGHLAVLCVHVHVYTMYRTPCYNEKH